MPQLFITDLSKYVVTSHIAIYLRKTKIIHENGYTVALESFIQAVTSYM